MCDTLGCHRFYYLAPVPVLDPICLSFDLRILVAHLASSDSCHCQLRNEISNMKVYLFNEFVYLITLTVQKCPLEDNDHFLFICSKYNNLRLVLLDSIQELIPTNNNADINIDLCLNENRSFCFDLSKEIFKAVQKYISDTHCFIYDAYFINPTSPIIHLFCFALFILTSRIFSFL
jgi:hypothetical protein